MNLFGASMSPDQAIKQETRNDRYPSFGFKMLLAATLVIADLKPASKIEPLEPLVKPQRAH